MLEKFYIGVNFKNVNLVQTLRHKYNSRSKNTSPKKNSFLQPYIISQLCPVGAVMPMLFWLMSNQIKIKYPLSPAKFGHSRNVQ